MKSQYAIRVLGKVQGVFFRKTTKEKADELGLKGIVMNEPDGSVYIVAQGTEDQLQKFLEYCQHGPEMAEVSQVLFEDLELSDFKDFSILS